MEGGVGGTDKITELTNEYRKNLTKSLMPNFRISFILNPLETEAKEQLANAGKARMVFFGADKIRQQKEEIIRRYEYETLPDALDTILQTETEIDNYKFIFYNVATIPILRRINFLDSANWDVLIRQYKFDNVRDENNAVSTLVHLLLDKYKDFLGNSIFIDKQDNLLVSKSRQFYNMKEFDFGSPQYRGKVEDYLSKHKSVFLTGIGHSTLLTKNINGTYRLFDPHGKVPGEPYSIYTKDFERKIENFIYPAKLTYVNRFQVQGGLPTCQLWTKIRSLHPEKSDAQFYDIVIQSLSDSGLVNKYGEDAGQHLDLLAIAIMHRCLNQGFLPPGTSQATKDQNRRGLGKHGGLGNTNVIDQMTDYFYDNLVKVGIDKNYVKTVLQTVADEAKQQLINAGKAILTLSLDKANKIRDKKEEIMDKYEYEILPKVIDNILETTNKYKDYAINFYNVKTIPILRRLGFLPPEYWTDLEDEFPYHPNDEPQPEIDGLQAKIREKNSEFFKYTLIFDKEPGAYFSRPNTVANDFGSPAYKGRIVHYLNNQKSVIIGGYGHAALLTLHIDGSYKIFDPHGTTPGGERSVFPKIFRDKIENLIYPAKLTKVNIFPVQGNKGVCLFLSKIRSLHPEKTDKEFKIMLENSAESTGLTKAFPRDWLKQLDLLVIATMKKFVREGYLFPNVSEATKITQRRGLGHQSRRVSESDSSCSCSCSDSESESDS